MKILLSPAKKLNFGATDCKIKTTPLFLDKTEELVHKMKSLSANKIADLMHLSPALANLNYERFQNFKETEEIKQAILAFDGEVYSGLDANTWSEELMNKAQEQIRILSGLYGILKPLDLIKAYRLEMGTSLPVKRKKNLYEFWKSTVTSAFTKELKKDELVVNLASIEYSKVLDFKQIENKVVEPVFKEFKNGDYKTIMVYAKKARGTMAKYIVANNIADYKGILDFREDGYAYNESLSSEQKPVFTR